MNTVNNETRRAREMFEAAIKELEQAGGDRNAGAFFTAALFGASELYATTHGAEALAKAFDQLSAHFDFEADMGVINHSTPKPRRS